VRALGIDVGVRNGMDLVVLDDFDVVATHQRIVLADLPGLIRGARADVVAIDSPPDWAVEGRSRRAERELARLGIHAYAVPTSERGMDHSFYEWMRIGFEVFRAAAKAGFPRYRHGPVLGTAVEVFPYASAVVLAGSLRPAAVAKRTWRGSVLQRHGLDPSACRSLDQIDAALAALTGLRALAGRSMAVGDPAEGVILLPARASPERPYRRT
jgi:predicted nuclease with RNAse H fold